MKFSTQREVLLTPLLHVSGVVEKRQTLPVLANLLVTADESGVSFTGTDLEVELVSRIEIPVDVPGETTIPARKFVDICKALPDGSLIKIETDGPKITISSGKSRFSLTGLASNDFPALEEKEVVERISLQEIELRKAITDASFAMAQQDVRYYLNGMLLEIDGTRLRTVATDGHRMASSDIEIDVNVNAECQIIIPRKGILELSRLLEDEESEVSLEVGRNHVRLKKENTVFTSKLIDGRFPDYEAVVPIGADNFLVMNRAEIKEALQRTAILSNEKYRGVRVELDNNMLKLSAHNPEQEEAIEEIEVDYSSAKLSMGYNVTYLLDALNAIKGDEALFCFKDETSSCVIREVESDATRHVVMPLRL